MLTDSVSHQRHETLPSHSQLLDSHTYQSRVNINESYYANVVLELLQQFLSDVSQISCAFIFQQTIPSEQTLDSQLSRPQL